MASFEILEDQFQKVTLKKGEEDKKKSVRVVLPKKRDNSSRIALQPIDNQVNPDIKRLRLSCKENVDLKPNKRMKIENEKPNCKKVKHVGVVLPVQSKIVLAPAQNKKQTQNVVNDLGYHDEYLRDLWSYLSNMEQKVKWPKPNYMSKQVHINFNMRRVLIDWLVTVAEEYKLSEQTLHLAVNYIDRFLSQMGINREKLQLLGSVAMLVAGKVEEIYPPECSDWEYLTDNSYTMHQILSMEKLLLKILKFDVQPPTILAFLLQLCVENKLDKDTMYLAMYISELILLEGDDYLQYLPSKIAASSVALARITLSKRQPWPKQLVSSCGYTLKELSPVVQRQNRTFADSPTTPQQAIQTKYKSAKYHKVAFIKPKKLNLDETENLV